MSNSQSPDNVSRKRRRFTVDPSPLNPVKLELAVILCLGLLLLLLQNRMPGGPWVQVALLAAYGGAAMLWLIFRTRRSVRRARRTGGG